MTTTTITVAGNSAPLTHNHFVAGGDSLAPTLINSYGAMTVTPYWRAMNLLAENLMSFGRSVTRNGAATPDGEPPHEATPLLKRSPNTYIGNAPIFWRALFFAFSHRGNGLARIERDPVTLKPRALHLVSIDDVKIGVFAMLDLPGATIEKWYLIRGIDEPVPARDMIHLQALSEDGLQGIDPVALHETTLQHAATLTRYATQFFRKGTMVKGAITFPASMTDAQLDSVAAYIKRNFTGPDAEKDLLLIPNDGKPSNFTMNPQQSQVVEQMVASTKAIAQITGLPPDLLFERSDSKYSGVEEAGDWLERYTFRPLVIQIEAELTAKLLSEADQDAGYAVHLNTAALLRGNVKTQTDTVMATVNGRVRTPNEGRAVLGLPKLDDAEADRLKAVGDTSPDESEGQIGVAEQHK